MLKTLSLFAVIVALGLVGCSNESSEPTPPADTPPDQAPTTQSSADASTTDEAVTDDYPLEVCVVSGEPLDSMGGPLEIRVKGRKVLLCCQGCEAAVRDNPDKYLAMIDAAVAGETPHDHDDHEGHDH